MSGTSKNKTCCESSKLALWNSNVGLWNFNAELWTTKIKIMGNVYEKRKSNYGGDITP